MLDLCFRNTFNNFKSFQDKNVESFVTFVNAQLRQRQEHERLKTIIARIESYDPVVSNSYLGCLYNIL